MYSEPTLRDELARERTIMANERTLLAYGNTALALVGLAIVIFKFASPDLVLVGCPLALTLALVVCFWGLRNYHAVAVRIAHEKQQNEPSFSLAEAD